MFLFGKSFHGYSITSNSDKISVSLSGNVLYPFDLKNAGATHAEMLPLKINDAGECVCLLWCDDKSRVACKAAPSLFFLSFGTQLSFQVSFFFFFFFLQCSWPCPFFFLQGPMLSWKSYNLNRFAEPTRCHPFNSFLQQPGVIICIVVILFATWVNTAQKMSMMKKLIRKYFIEAATCTAAKGWEESFKRSSWGKRAYEEYMECFLSSSRLQHRVLVRFFQVLLTWLSPLKFNTFFCSLQWVKKVTAQMVPSPLVKFWHGSLFVTSTVCMYDRTP